MSEFVVKIEDEIVQAIGQQSIEKFVQSLVAKTILNFAAKDVLSDYDESDVTNEDSWSKSWKETFDNDSYSKFIKVYPNV